MIERFFEHHEWFCRHSLTYVGVWEWHDKDTRYEWAEIKYRFKDLLYWPIAWMKFMWYSEDDILKTIRQ